MPVTACRWMQELKIRIFIISVTESDELNLLCCTVAKQVGDCAAIARVRTPDYSKEAGYLREKLGLAMIINPELEAAREAARILFLPSALEVNSFAHGQAELIKFAIPAGNILEWASDSRAPWKDRNEYSCMRCRERWRSTYSFW